MLVRTYADRIVVLLDGETVADHPRSFKRDQVVYDPWHYVPVLARKPGALRDAAAWLGRIDALWSGRLDRLDEFLTRQTEE